MKYAFRKKVLFQCIKNSSFWVFTFEIAFRRVNIVVCVCVEIRKNCLNHDVKRRNRVSSENALKKGNSFTEIFDVTRPIYVVNTTPVYVYK